MHTVMARNQLLLRWCMGNMMYTIKMLRENWKIGTSSATLCPQPDWSPISSAAARRITTACRKRRKSYSFNLVKNGFSRFSRNLRRLYLAIYTWIDSFWRSGSTGVNFSGIGSSPGALERKFDWMNKKYRDWYHSIQLVKWSLSIPTVPRKIVLVTI